MLSEKKREPGNLKKNTPRIPTANRPEHQGGEEKDYPEPVPVAAHRYPFTDRPQDFGALCDTDKHWQGNESHHEAETTWL